MSAPGVGHEYPPVAVSWLKRDVLLFANSIGCQADELHFLFVSYQARLKKPNVFHALFKLDSN